MDLRDLQTAAEFRANVAELWERDRSKILELGSEQYVAIFPDGPESALSQPVVEEAVRGLPYVTQVKRSLRTPEIPFHGWQVFFRSYVVYDARKVG
jgi:hypothetical protein